MVESARITSRTFYSSVRVKQKWKYFHHKRFGHVTRVQKDLRWSLKILRDVKQIRRISVWLFIPLCSVIVRNKVDKIASNQICQKKARALSAGVNWIWFSGIKLTIILFCSLGDWTRGISMIIGMSTFYSRHHA